MAGRGNGVFQEFRNQDIQNLGLGALDYTSLASKNVLKTLMVRSLRSVPNGNGRAVDSDGDGLKDDNDQPFVHGTNQFIADSRWRLLRRQLRGHPRRPGLRGRTTKDIRGCDPASPLTRNCICRDTDGDGLSQFAEAYLKTRAGLVDSDGDGIPDGLEAQYGLDPLASNNGVDTDNDGVSDLEEIKAGTDPTRPDKNLYDLTAVQYTSKAEIQPDGSVCYDYVVSNLELVTPPNGVGAAQAGYNLFKVWFAEAPESAVSSDYGVWKAACAWAQYDASGIRVPAGPDIQVDDAAFLAAQPPDQRSGLPDSLRGDAAVRTHRARLLAAALAGMLGLGIACTQSYLYDERRRDQLPTDRTLVLEGRFCTLGTNDVVRPIKILFAFDASPVDAGQRPERHPGLRGGPAAQLAAPGPEHRVQRDALRREHHRLAHQERPGRVRAAAVLQPGGLHHARGPDPQLHQSQRQPRLDRLHQGAVRDLRHPQHRHHREPERGGRRPGRTRGPATSSSSSPTATPPSTRTTSSSRATRSAASGSSGSWWTT